MLVYLHFSAFTDSIFNANSVEFIKYTTIMTNKLRMEGVFTRGHGPVKQ